MRRTAAVLAGLCLLALGGCANEQTARDNEAYRAEQQAGGSLPWNRPQSWEGAGALGSQMNQFNQ
ncbi:MAG: hypothetical protein Fur0032_01070 [Terrimicrobiaceae bacterium]